ncbi:MAG TPA: hypothetical protein VHX65_19325 [Pirellulales bacterium]|nr:hypothetical protein [Pirellulales bacterium]
MLSRDFLSMVRCPEDRSALTLADEPLVDEMNRAIADGRLKNRAGNTVRRSVDGGLVREDRSVVYPIVDQIPILLLDEGILLDQLGNAE